MNKCTYNKNAASLRNRGLKKGIYIYSPADWQCSFSGRWLLPFIYGKIKLCERTLSSPHAKHSFVIIINGYRSEKCRI